MRARPVLLAVTALLASAFAAPAGAGSCVGDADGDGVCDPQDNCLRAANPDQLDSDLDGFGNACDGDYDNDGLVGASDWNAFLQAFGSTARDARFLPAADVEGTDVIGYAGLGVIVRAFGLPPGPSGLACAGSIPCAAPAPSLTAAQHVLNRIAYGPDAWSQSRIEELGVEGYIREQLHPETIDDSALEALLAQFPALGKSHAELHDRRVYGRGGTFGSQVPLAELTQARLLRAVLSRRQLVEVLVDFWFNHFNVYSGAGDGRLDVVPYERDAIRAFVLGRFQDMLLATARSPAMLGYLDNKLNWVNRINENYGREIMELHTLGVEGGYDQADVIAVARCFTGWLVDYTAQDGFLYRDAWHDQGVKSVMGALQIPANGGYQDGLDVIAFLAHHPKTATRIASKLARRFVSEEPPPALVEAAAQTFLATDGDLRAVMETLLLSPEFLAAPGEHRARIKSPLVLMASFGRAAHVDPQPMLLPLRDAVATLGEPLYLADPPTGYPETSAYWVGGGSMLSRFNLLESAARGANGFAIAYDVSGGTSAEIVDGLAAQLVNGPVGPATRSQAIVMLQSLARWPAAERIQQAAALLLSSADNLRY